MDRVALRERVRDGGGGGRATCRGWQPSAVPGVAVGGGGLFELRVGLGRVARRVTFCFAEDRRIVLLTTFSQAEAERAGRSPARSGGDAAVYR